MRMAWFNNRKIRADRSGATAVEFALLAPVLVMLTFGSIQYGLYFGVAHSVQQLCNDAARVAVAGLNVKEREGLVKAHVDKRGADYSFLRKERIRSSVNDDGEVIVVRTDYDASNLPIFTLKGLMPMPPSTITQKSVVALGGY
jgi:Flp pilus assembly protein TadG